MVHERIRAQSKLLEPSLGVFGQKFCGFLDHLLKGASSSACCRLLKRDAEEISVGAPLSPSDRYLSPVPIQVRTSNYKEASLSS